MSSRIRSSSGSRGRESSSSNSSSSSSRGRKSSSSSSSSREETHELWPYTTWIHTGGVGTLTRPAAFFLSASFELAFSMPASSCGAAVPYITWKPLVVCVMVTTLPLSHVTDTSPSHMLTYASCPCISRLGTKADKMAGLIDFDTAFQQEVRQGWALAGLEKKGAGTHISHAHTDACTRAHTHTLTCRRCAS